MAATARAGQDTRTDWWLLLIVLVTVLLGLAIIYSASFGFALIKGSRSEGQPGYYVQRQALFVLLGLVSMYVLARIDYHKYPRYALHILIATIVVLLPMVFTRNNAMGGAARWFYRGSVQPAEIARVGATIYIAIWLASRREQLRSLTLGLAPFSLLVGSVAGLIMLQPNYSTAVLLVATAAVMLFVAGADIKQLLIGFLVGGAALALLAWLALYRRERIESWLYGPFNDVYGRGQQVVQCLMALNRGGLLGVGLAQSQFKFSVFAPHTDSVYAIVGEELGFWGALLIMTLYALWTWRGLRVAFHARDTLGMLLAVGLVSWVTFQAILHIAVTTASTPYTGTVLPFISYGGSSVASCLASVGILINISRGGGAPLEERPT